VASRRRRRQGSRPSWGVVLLSLGVAATSITVPPLVLSWSAQEEPAPSAGPAGSPVPPPATSVASTPVSIPVTTVPVTGASPTRTATAFRRIRIDAADPANETSGTAVTGCPLCASGRRVQYLGQGHYLIVHVRGVPVGGRRTLTIVYETAEPRPLDVAVNGEPARRLTLPGAGSWTAPARVSLPIDLPAGDSVLKFFRQEQAAPDLDQFLITP